jgi:hypothetical protein
MRDPYEVLGIRPDATDTEVKNAYRRLARKYHPDNYASDPAKAEEAEEKMKEINAAYDEIQARRAGKGTHSSEYGFTEVRRMIQQGRFGEADRLLSAVPEEQRTAEWHYLRSIVLTRRGWVNDAMRELETACRMDPGNVEYQRAKEMFNQTAAGYGSTYYGQTGTRPVQTCSGCDVCQGLICADCCCECMGGDLIRCC